MDDQKEVVDAERPPSDPDVKQISYICIYTYTYMFIKPPKVYPANEEIENMHIGELYRNTKGVRIWSVCQMAHIRFCPNDQNHPLL